MNFANVGFFRELLLFLKYKITVTRPSGILYIRSYSIHSRPFVSSNFIFLISVFIILYKDIIFVNINLRYFYIHDKYNRMFRKSGTE